MTDREDFEALMKRFDIPFTTEDSYGFSLDLEEGELCIRAKTSDKIDGYSDFVTYWAFDANGKFVKVGIWE